MPSSFVSASAFIVAGLFTTILVGCGASSSATGTSSTTLTVKNYLQWCSVSVNGATASTALVQTVSATNTTVNLSATAASTTFQLGDWHHTTGDAGSGDPGTIVGGTSSTTVVTHSSNSCVWVCCPFATGPGECPSTDQCP